MLSGKAKYSFYTECSISNNEVGSTSGITDCSPSLKLFNGHP